MANQLMSRGQVNTVCIGDKIEMISGHQCTVVDLEYILDSDGTNQILATLIEDATRLKRTTNLLMCRLVQK